MRWIFPSYVGVCKYCTYMSSDSQHPEPLRRCPRGLAKAKRIGGIRQRRIHVLTRAAEDLLFANATVLSEGRLRKNAGGEHYDGSTMITFDLRPLADEWRGVFDERAYDSLLDLVEGSVRIRIRTLRIARREAARRLAGYNLGRVAADTQVRLEGATLLLDVDLEVEVRVSSAVVEQ